ncbi:MAG: SpoIIE family protein phosphatase [Polyangia bacterium]
MNQPARKIPRELGSAQRAAEGETECGDAFLILDEPESVTLALADGLGHGTEAAKAAQAFCEEVRRHVALPLDEILQRAHQALRPTRGAAAAILRIHRLQNASLEARFAGVGNIALAVATQTPAAPISIAGTLGARLRRVTIFRFPLALGDLLVLHSDGIRSHFDARDLGQRPAQALAEDLLLRHGRLEDDATCLVVRV